MGIRNVELSDDQTLRWQETIQRLGYEVVEEELTPTTCVGVTRVAGRAFILRKADKWVRVYTDQKPNTEGIWFMIFMEHESGGSWKLVPQIGISVPSEKDSTQTAYLL